MFEFRVSYVCIFIRSLFFTGQYNIESIYGVILYTCRYLHNFRFFNTIVLSLLPNHVSHIYWWDNILIVDQQIARLLLVMS